jgi:hypothetical protein
MQHINPKVLLGLGAATGVAVLAAVLLAGQRQPSTGPAAAAYALPELRAHLNDVKGLALKGAEDKPVVTLVRQEQGWTVQEKGGYPADSGKLRAALLKLSEARLVAPKTQNAQRYPELGVEDMSAKDAKGVLLSLDGLPHPARLILGNASAQGQGTFVRVPGEPQSWLASGALSLDRDPARWLDTALADIPANRIAEVVLTRPGTKPLRLHKDQPSDTAYKLDDLPAGRSADPAKLTEAASALAGLSFADVAPAAAVQPPADNQRLKAHYRTFDGLAVDIQAWAQDGQHRALFSAAFDRAAAAARLAAEPDRQAKLDALSQEAEALKRRFAGWSFVIPAAKYASLDKAVADLLWPAADKAPAKAKPSAPAKPGKH